MGELKQVEDGSGRAIRIRTLVGKLVGFLFCNMLIAGLTNVWAGVVAYWVVVLAIFVVAISAWFVLPTGPLRKTSAGVSHWQRITAGGSLVAYVCLSTFSAATWSLPLAILSSALFGIAAALLIWPATRAGLPETILMMTTLPLAGSTAVFALAVWQGQAYDRGAEFVINGRPQQAISLLLLSCATLVAGPVLALSSRKLTWFGWSTVLSGLGLTLGQLDPLPRGISHVAHVLAVMISLLVLVVGIGIVLEARSPRAQPRAILRKWVAVPLGLAMLSAAVVAIVDHRSWWGTSALLCFGAGTILVGFGSREWLVVAGLMTCGFGTGLLGVELILNGPVAMGIGLVTSAFLLLLAIGAAVLRPTLLVEWSRRVNKWLSTPRA